MRTTPRTTGTESDGLRRFAGPRTTAPRVDGLRCGADEVTTPTGPARRAQGPLTRETGRGGAGAGFSGRSGNVRRGRPYRHYGARWWAPQESKRSSAAAASRSTVPYPCATADVSSLVRSSQAFSASHGALLLEAARPYGFVTSPPSVFAALFPASVATHDTKSEPHQGPEDCGDNGIEPQRPREVPDQEVKSDLLGVLDDEYEKQSNSDERCNCSTTESGAVLAAGTRIRVRHNDPLPHIDHLTKRPTCVPSMSHGGIRHAHPFSIPRGRSLGSRRRGDQRGGAAPGGRRRYHRGVGRARPRTRSRDVVRVVGGLPRTEHNGGNQRC